MNLTLLFLKLMVSVAVMFLDVSAFFVLIKLLFPQSVNPWIRSIQQTGQTLVSRWQQFFDRVWLRLGIGVSERFSLGMNLVSLVFIRCVIEILTLGLRG